MKRFLLTITILTSFTLFGQKETATSNNEKKSQDKKVGQQLFKSILDTVKIQTITVDLLKNNKWVYKPMDKCYSYFNFKDNRTGQSYNCEMDEEYEMIYKIEKNKLFISEYDIPEVDNEMKKKIKTRYDTYIYTGNSLIMIDSEMYNVSGRAWTPKIEVIISYNRN